MMVCQDNLKSQTTTQPQHHFHAHCSRLRLGKKARAKVTVVLHQSRGIPHYHFRVKDLPGSQPDVIYTSSARRGNLQLRNAYGENNFYVALLYAKTTFHSTSSNSLDSLHIQSQFLHNGCSYWYLFISTVLFAVRISSMSPLAAPCRFVRSSQRSTIPSISCT